MQTLTVKYRPGTLAEVRGHEAIIRKLQTYAADPYPCALLFHGDTGVGKTATALALARALGAGVTAEGVELHNPEYAEAAGLYMLSSNKLSVEKIRETQDRLRHYGRSMFGGTGWRVVIVDEADVMSKEAQDSWLSLLDDPPANTTVIFTCNSGHKLAQRFLHRCEYHHFDFGIESAPTEAKRAANVQPAATPAAGRFGTAPIRALQHLAHP